MRIFLVEPTNKLSFCKLFLLGVVGEGHFVTVMGILWKETEKNPIFSVENETPTTE